MIPAELFVPSFEELALLASIRPGPLYARRKNTSMSFYVLSDAGHWVTMFASQGDVHFDKSGALFQVPGLSIRSTPGTPSIGLVQTNSTVDALPSGLVQIANIPDFAFLTYLIRAHWIESPLSGVSLDSTIKSGPMDTIPDSASAIGASLFGVVFHDLHQDPLLLITMDEERRKDVRLVTDLNVMARIVDECDPFFSAVDAILPALSAQRH